MFFSLSLFSLSHMELINLLYIYIKKKIGGNGLGAKRLGLGGETTRVPKRGETTRGETTRGETSWARNVLLPLAFQMT